MEGFKISKIKNKEEVKEYTKGNCEAQNESIKDKEFVAQVIRRSYPALVTRSCAPLQIPLVHYYTLRFLTTARKWGRFSNFSKKAKLKLKATSERQTD